MKIWLDRLAQVGYLGKASLVNLLIPLINELSSLLPYDITYSNYFINPYYQSD